jgi:hypothetical protein
MAKLANIMPTAAQLSGTAKTGPITKKEVPQGTKLHNQTPDDFFPLAKQVFEPYDVTYTTYVTGHNEITVIPASNGTETITVNP